MAFISRTELRGYATLNEGFAKAARTRSLGKSGAQTSVFLSHSHKDEDLVRAAVSFLNAQGVSVYVDWMDEGMPDQTSVETAARIKSAIAANAKFILLATSLSLSSRWVPWELGCADGIKGSARMAVFAVREDSGSFPGNEYVSLYPRIENTNDDDWGVFPPGSNSGGVYLSTWLKS